MILSVTTRQRFKTPIGRSDSTASGLKVTSVVDERFLACACSKKLRPVSSVLCNWIPTPMVKLHLNSKTFASKLFQCSELTKNLPPSSLEDSQDWRLPSLSLSKVHFNTSSTAQLPVLRTFLLTPHRSREVSLRLEFEMLCHGHRWVVPPLQGSTDLIYSEPSLLDRAIIDRSITPIVHPMASLGILGGNLNVDPLFDLGRHLVDSQFHPDPSNRLVISPPTCKDDLLSDSESYHAPSPTFSLPILDSFRQRNISGPPASPMSIAGSNTPTMATRIARSVSDAGSPESASSTE